MSIKNVIILLIVMMSQAILAGDKKGNGAGFVVCPTHTTLLDFYEGNLIDFNWEGNELELATYIINKHRDLSPVRAEAYIKHINNFYNETKFESGSEIGYIPDAGTIRVEIPNECRLVQGVLQKLVVFGQEKRYLINNFQWNKLNTINKAGVILHEIIYRELQSPNSYYIRNFVNWLFSTALEPINPKAFYQQLKNAEFKWVYLNGFPMSAEKLIIDDSPIRSKFSYPYLPFLIFNQTVMSTSHIIDSYSNGRPKVIQYTGKILHETGLYFLEICSNSPSTTCKVNLGQNGLINVMNNVNITDKKTGLKIENVNVSLDSAGEVDQVL